MIQYQDRLVLIFFPAWSQATKKNDQAHVKCKHYKIVRKKLTVNPGLFQGKF